MNRLDQEAEFIRADTIARARELCTAWAYWCFYCQWGEVGGRRPRIVSGGMDHRYRPPCQWHPPEPKFPEANEISGLAVQKAFIQLPERPYRKILRAEFCLKPWIVPLKEGELEVAIAHKARVSIGAYQITLERALLALANVMKRKGMFK